MKKTQKKTSKVQGKIRKVEISPRTRVHKSQTSTKAFSSEKLKLESMTPTDGRIEFRPYGLALGPLETRPVFLLRSLDEQLILPIWLNQKEAVDSLGGVQATAQSPHILTEQILSHLQSEVVCCEFTELEGAQQWVLIHISHRGSIQKIKTKAASALALGLHLKIPFYASYEFVQSCRNIEASLFQEFAQIDSRGLDKKRNHNYLM